MEWTPEITTTVGGVLIAAMAVLYRFLGQRADPQLVGVALSFTKLVESVSTDNKAIFLRLATSVDENTAYTKQSTEAFGQLVTYIKSNIGDKLDNLTTEVTTGTSEVMATRQEVVGIMKKLNEPETAPTTGQKLDTLIQSVQALKDELSLWRTEFTTLSNKHEQMETNVGAMQDKVEQIAEQVKRETQETPVVSASPDNQPVVIPSPEKPKEQEKPNDV